MSYPVKGNCAALRRKNMEENNTYTQENFANQNAYAPQQPTATKVARPSGLETAGLVLGIIAIVIAFVPFLNFFAFIMGILAIVFGTISLCRRCPRIARSITAIVLAVLSIFISIAMDIIVIRAMRASYDRYREEIDSIYGDVLYELPGDTTEDILENHLDVTIGKFTVTSKEYYADTALKVTLKNKSNKMRSFSVKIEAVDESGNRLKTDYTYVSDLNAGQSQIVELFTYVPEEDIPAMKKATFKVLEVTMY